MGQFPGRQSNEISKGYRDTPKRKNARKSKINAERRVIHVSETSGYAKFARYIVGKLVRLKEKANIGGNSWYCEFVHDDDRRALNLAAGWSDNKREYLFDGVRFKK